MLGFKKEDPKDIPRTFLERLAPRGWALWIASFLKQAKEIHFWSVWYQDLHYEPDAICHILPDHGIPWAVLEKRKVSFLGQWIVIGTELCQILTMPIKIKLLLAFIAVANTLGFSSWTDKVLFHSNQDTDTGVKTTWHIWVTKHPSCLAHHKNWDTTYSCMVSPLRTSAMILIPPSLLKRVATKNLNYS